MKAFYVVIGGGPAGFFAAIHLKANHPERSVVLVEKGKEFLTKVRVSGGGRCNLTNACFDPKKLVENYPRGSKELLGLFHRFQPKDTVNWFEEHGVPLIEEAHGRMFPATESSQTVIDCLVHEAKKLGVILLKETEVTDIQKADSGQFVVSIKDKEAISAERVILTTGGGSGPCIWLQKMGHTIERQIPSLFPLSCSTSSIKDLSGNSVDPVFLSMYDKKMSGSILITHQGFSGPAALKLSSLCAKILFENNYKGVLKINWLHTMTEGQVLNELEKLKELFPQSHISSKNMIAKVLWKRFLELLGIAETEKLINISRKKFIALAQKLTADSYAIDGKHHGKDEFVTCGGVKLSEVNFQTMESKIVPGLYLAGEILDIDGLTGGFNLQNAWTTGYIAGQSSL